MAIVHQATLTPTKIELLERWLPGQDWYTGSSATPIARAGAFRFDDPAGEVGVETLLIRAGDDVFQVPLSYRGAPLAGADAFLVGTMEHSVLGSRWVYDATGDPVYAAALVGSVLTGTGQSAVFLEGSAEPLPESVRLVSAGADAVAVPAIAAVTAATDGAVTTIHAPGVDAAVQRVLRAGAVPSERGTLSATWEGQTEPVLLAVVTLV